MARRNREIQVFSVSFLDMLCCALGGVLLLLLSSLINNQSLADKASRLFAELGIALNEVDTTKGALNKAVRDIEEGKAEGAVILGDAQKTRTALLGAVAKLGAAERDRDRAVAEAAGLKKQLNEIEVRFKQSNGDVDKIRGERDDVTKKYDAAVKDKLRADGSIRDLERTIEGLRGTLVDTKGQLDRSLVEIGEVRKQFQGVVALSGPMKNVVFVFDHSQSLSLKDNRFLEHCALLNSWIENLPFERFGVVAYNNNISP